MTKNQIIEQLFTGKNFNECLQKMEPESLREDLRQEVILIICELPAARVQQLHRSKALEFFTVRVILNQIKSSTSPFARKYRQSQLTYMEDVGELKRLNETQKRKLARVGLSVSNVQAPDTIEIEERALREMIEDMAIEEVDKLYWYNKGLIELYVQYGNFRAIQRETGIPFGSCYKTIKKSFNEIKMKVR